MSVVPESWKLPPYKVRFTVSANELGQVVPWGVTYLGITELQKKTRGAGIKIAVADTGIDATHPDFAGAILVAKDFTGSPHGADDKHGHGCLHPNGIVYTSFCGLETIETLYNRTAIREQELPNGVRLKDMSALGLSTVSLDKATGQTQRDQIMALHKIPVAESVVRIKHSEGEIVLTPWHPCYIFPAGGRRTVIEVRADKIKTGDRLWRSRTSVGVRDEPLSYEVARPKCGHCGWLVKQRAVFSGKLRCKKCLRQNWVADVRRYALDEELAYLLGLIVTDGSFTDLPGRREVSFHNKDANLLKRFWRLARKIFVNRITGFERTSKNGLTEIRLSGDIFQVCEQIGVIGLKTVRPLLPEAISKSPPGIILAFLAGIIDGDGSVNKKDGRIRFVTSRLDQANRLRQIVLVLGGSASIHASPAHGKFSAGFQVHIAVDGLERSLKVQRANSKPQRQRNASKVLAVSREPFDGYFYDFTTAHTHTYWGDGTFISNTHTAGTIGARDNGQGIIGIAPECELLIAKVLGDDGSGGSDSIATGLHWAVDNGAQIISMSLGSPQGDDVMREGLQYAVDHGVLVIGAAGNEGASGVGYPAAWNDLAEAIAAIDQQGRVAGFSSIGEQVDVCAPGVHVVSCWPGNRYSYSDGTSMACPHVAGGVALVQAYRKQNNLPLIQNQGELNKVIHATAKTTLLVPSPSYGYGIFNPAAMCDYGVMAPPTGQKMRVSIGQFLGHSWELVGTPLVN